MIECELTKSTLLVASLDRLSRDVLFLELLKRRCEAGNFGFRVVDMPDANSLTLGIMIQLAQFEREQVSKRTKRALAAAKARGTVLGNPQGVEAFQGRQSVGVVNAATINRTTADAWAAKRKPVLAKLVSEGLNLSAIARELTSRGISTRRGGAWSARIVSDLIGRLGLATA